ncbi:MAG: TIGR00341 family protein [Saprospiraceae bacterium]
MNIKFLNRFNLINEREEFEIVLDDVKRNALTEGTNLWILFFAILIASLGLNVNSTPVVIGAMLISPLIGPIVGVGFGAATNDLKLIRTSLRSYLFSTLVGLIASTIYFIVTPITTAQPEILSRIFPSFYDVLIALFGGFAGIIALATKQKGNVIPGVAIATAIMPPLCTAGYGLANMEWYYFLGAFYLFLINSVFIFTATIITTHLLKFPSKKYSDPLLEKKERRIVWSIIVLTLIPSLYLGYDLVGNYKFEEKAARFIETEASFKNDYLLKKEIYPRSKSIILTYGGREITREEIAATEAKLKYFGLADATLEIRYGFSLSSDQKNDDQLNKIAIALNESTNENKTLMSELDSIRHYEDVGATVFRELKILYPDFKKAVIQPVKMSSDSSEIQIQSYLVLLTSKKNIPTIDKEKLKRWLQERINNTKIELIIFTES